MKKKIGILALLMALVCALAACGAGASTSAGSAAASGGTAASGSAAASTKDGTISVSVSVVHGDGTKKDFTFDTSCDNLGDALMEQHIVRGENGAYGLFITTADDETADDTKEQWWCLTKGGASVETGADSTPIKDGDAFELTLTTGY